MVVEVDRDQGLVGVGDDALQRPALRRRLEDAVHFLKRGVALRRESEVDQADVRRRHPHGRAVELALQFRQHLADGARSEEHTSELQSLMRISYAGFCLKKKKQKNINTNTA